MRFHWGSIPETPDFVPDETWLPVREPSLRALRFITLPAAFLLCCALLVMWLGCVPVSPPPERISGIDMLLVLFTVMCAHVLIHALTHPSQGRSSDTVLGFWPKKLIFFSHFQGVLTRNRFVAILLMPFILLSLVPWMAGVLLQTSSGWLVFASAYNAAFSAGDIVGSILLLSQLPGNAVIRNVGWKSYWKLRTLQTIEQEAPLA